VVWALYCIYFVFGAWWFLRFLLPSWPALCIGTAALVAPLVARPTRLPRAVAIAVLLAVGIYGLIAAHQRDVFPDDEGERRYATIAGLVARQTGSDAIILASMHTGPTRYYAGRATMRYDLLDPAWLDKAVEWLRRDGHHPYVLVEDWEMRDFIARFRAKNPNSGALAASPVLAYRAYNIGGTVYLFDLLRPDAPTFAPPPIRDPRPRCPLPAPSPQL
jgi:hypothetical protein